MADRTGVGVDVRTYADPDLEAMRVAITDAEVTQAIGRGRGINRSAGTPLDVFIMADVVLPLPVHRLVRWADLRLDVVARMLARGALLFSASDAARAYPDLFPTPEAARKAIQRAEVEKGISRTFPYDYLFLGECPGNQLVGVTYRPAGRGQQQRTAKVAAGGSMRLRNGLRRCWGHSWLTRWRTSRRLRHPPQRIRSPHRSPTT